MRAIWIASILLAGCGVIAPPSQLVQPAARCMTKPYGVERLSVGDDLVAKHQVLLGRYAKEASKLRCLQRWIKTATN